MSGGSFGKSESESESRSGVPDFQRDLLESLFNRGDSLSKSLQPQANQLSNQITGQIAPQALDTFRQLSQGGANPFLDSQISALGNDINTNVQRNLLPAVQNDAINAGQFGNDRTGVAEGIVLADANRAFANEASNLRSNGFGQTLQGQLGALSQTSALAGLGESAINLQFLPTLLQRQNLNQVINESSSESSSGSFSLGF